jgi:transcriptional regulator with XRE-family HTH domain
VDERIKSLKEKRKQLGWTIKLLAEKADLSFGEALHVERKGIYCHAKVSGI